MSRLRLSWLLALWVLVLVFPACRRGTRPSQSRDQARSQDMWIRVGETLAREAVARAGPEGRLLILRAETNAVMGEEQDAVVKTLLAETRALAKAGGPVTVAVPNAPRPAGADESYPTLPAPLTLARVQEAVSKAAPVAVVVSLLGVPAGAPPKESSLPPLLCLAPAAGAELADWILSGRVPAALAARRDATSAEKDWFAIRFVLLTRENVEAWAAAATR